MFDTCAGLDKRAILFVGIATAISLVAILARPSIFLHVAVFVAALVCFMTVTLVLIFASLLVTSACIVGFGDTQTQGPYTLNPEPKPQT